MAVESHPAKGSRNGRRGDLSDFLRSRRARLTPQDVQLPTRGRRRTPGLRREEVAYLAGIGVSWYTYLEQGRDITVTPRVLDGISEALRLDEQERSYLYRMAGHTPPEQVTVNCDSLPEALRGILSTWEPNPAYVLDRYWRFVAGNQPVRRLFTRLRPGDSCLDAFDRSSEMRQSVLGWAELAGHLVAGFRAQMARFSEDTEFEAIVSRLLKSSDEFAKLWSRHDVSTTASGTKIVNHPELGSLAFTRTALQLVDAPEHRVVLLVPQPETKLVLTRALAIQST